jgi:hypothetical protein
MAAILVTTYREENNQPESCIIVRMGILFKDMIFAPGQFDILRFIEIGREYKAAVDENAPTGIVLSVPRKGNYMFRPKDDRAGAREFFMNFWVKHFDIDWTVFDPNAEDADLTYYRVDREGNVLADLGPE